jgi:hypothetical protein
MGLIQLKNKYFRRVLDGFAGSINRAVKSPLWVGHNWKQSSFVGF